MEERWVSVITPTYNRSRRLMECVESVRRQRYPFVEHIVIDDGSTDGTAEMIQKVFPDLIRGGRLKVLRQDNAGPGSARNFGLAAARGEFVTYLDSDDVFLDSHAAELVKPMLSDDRVGIAYADHVERWYSPEGKVLREKSGPLQAVDSIQLRYKNLIPIMFMHRKCLVEQVGGFDTDRLGLEDWDFLMRMSEVSRLQWVPAVTAIWRHLSDVSITDTLKGDLRESKYQGVLKRAMQRELAGKILEDDLRQKIEALNWAVLGGMVEAARRRANAPEGHIQQTVAIKFEKIRSGEFDSLLELIRMNLAAFHRGFNLEMVLPREDTPATEWIGKINRMLESEGLQKIFVKIEKPTIAGRT